MNEKKHEKELKRLSRIIMNVLTRDSEVMAYLAELKEREIIDSSTLLGLALKVDDLLEVSGKAFYHKERKSAAKLRGKKFQKKTDAANSEQRELIDGQELSVKEIEFERWVAENFDQSEWLNRVGIIW